tara:strand:- start:509 stop:688 length:180 start_codon:yes stop_codon:yes gene_type:complete
MIKELLEDVMKDLDIKMYLLKIQVYLAKAFRYLAKSVFFVFFYKEKEKKKEYDETELFI